MPMGGGGGGEVPFGVEASMMLRHSAAAANSKLCHWSDLDLCLVLALDSNALLLASLSLILTCKALYTADRYLVR